MRGERHREWYAALARIKVSGWRTMTLLSRASIINEPRLLLKGSLFEKDFNSSLVTGDTYAARYAALARVIMPSCNKIEGRTSATADSRCIRGQKAKKGSLAVEFPSLPGVQRTEKKKRTSSTGPSYRVVAISRFHRRTRARANAYVQKGTYE